MIEIEVDEEVSALLRRADQRYTTGRRRVVAALQARDPGKVAVFGFFLDKEILVDVSLKGFTKAYNSLKPVAAKAN